MRRDLYVDIDLLMCATHCALSFQFIPLKEEGRCPVIFLSTLPLKEVGRYCVSFRSPFKEPKALAHAKGLGSLDLVIQMRPELRYTIFNFYHGCHVRPSDSV